MAPKGGNQQLAAAAAVKKPTAVGGGGGGGSLYVGGGSFYATWLPTATDGPVSAQLVVLPSEGLTYGAVLAKIQAIVPGFAKQLFYRGMYLL
jgi:hypothetical protein